MLFVLYMLLCLLVAFIGRKTQIGLWGFFILSVLLSPIIGFLVVVISSPRRDPAGEVH